MRILSQQFLIAAFALSSAVVLIAQQPQPTAWAVPRVVRLSSSFRPVNGLAVLPVENILVAIYAEEVGGVALWQETQNVTMEGEGRFSVLLGSTRNEGLPLELFATGEPRWVGVQFQRPGEVEQARVLLASVPYALKAVDADTLGGQPASAYLLAPSTAPAASTSIAGPNTETSVKPARLTPKFTSGTTNHIAKFVTNLDLGDSGMVEANGKIGIGTSVPAAALEISTVGGGAQFTNVAANNFTFNTFSSPGNASYLYNFGNAYPTSGRFMQSSTLLDAGSILSLSAASNIRFYTSGNNERVRIIGNGNVGIGTVAPATKLDVSGDINHTGNLFKGGIVFLHNLGTNNTAVGFNALPPPFTGTDNTATGSQALLGITSGSHNTGTGSNVLYSNSTGNYNTAVGDNALYTNSDGHENAAVGSGAMRSNTSGFSNTAVGHDAMASNTTGYQNTAVGLGALSSTLNTADTVAVGSFALKSNTSGGDNVAVGHEAMLNNISGTGNVAIGYASGFFLTTGDSNVIIGSHPGVAGMAKTIIIGEGVGSDPYHFQDLQTRTFIAGIKGVIPGNHDGVPVLIDSAGQLGTSNSSLRYKENIQSMAGASSNLMLLRPVTYRYKQAYEDGSKPIDYGLIAEEVAEVYPDLVVKSKDGQIETVQYQKLTPMLLNEVQKQNNEIVKLHQDAVKQSRDIAALKAKLDGMSELEGRFAVLEALISNKPSTAPTAGQ